MPPSPPRPPREYVKLYKNGKFEVQFHNEKDVVTMAEVLLSIA